MRNRILYLVLTLAGFCAISILLGLTATGCNFQYAKPLEGSGFGAGRPRSGRIGYDEIRRTVLEPSCLGCHGQKAPLLTSYAEVLSVATQIRKAAVEDGSMPQGGALAADARSLLRDWLDEGAPETAPEPPITVVPTLPEPGGTGPERPVRFATLREKVLQPSCLACHHAGNPDGLTDYSDAAGLRSTAATLFYLTAIDPQMPPLPAALSRDQKDLIAAWLVDGMQD